MITNHYSGTTLSGMLKETTINIAFYPLIRWCFPLQWLIFPHILFTWMEDMPKIKSSILDPIHSFILVMAV